MGNITTTHVWDGGHIVAERNQAGGVMNRFDRGAGQRVIRSEHHGFYLYNARGDVVQRANAAGVVTHSYRYTAFGNELAGNQSANETSTNPWRYAGEYWDAHRGEYYLRARSFNPRLGRFTQPDPFWNIRNMQRSTAAITQAGNLFMYTMHNPVMWVDPTGWFISLPGRGGPPGAPLTSTGSSSVVNHGVPTGSKQIKKSPGVSTSVHGTTPPTQAPGLSPLERSWSFSGTPIKCTSPNPKKMDSLEGGGGGRGGVPGTGGGKVGNNTSNSSGASNSGNRAGTTTVTTVPTIPSKTTLITSATTPGRGNVTPVGRAYQKHQTRPNTVFTGPQSGSAAQNTQHGMAHLERILNDPSTTFTLAFNNTHGDVLKVRMLDGTGAMWSADGTRFIMFLEPYTNIAP